MSFRARKAKSRASTASSRRSTRLPSEQEDNPFRLTGDEDIFELRDEERKKKALERERQKSLKIWQKNPVPAFKQLVRSNIRPKVKVGAEETTSPSRRRPPETMNDFIAKKRAMFLMEMSLNTKSEEIKKLEDKAQMKKEALERSEKMLDEDAARFDEFLKKNDIEAHKAFKAADKEIKAKQEKIAELKKLNVEMTRVEDQTAKLKERLTECQKYKAFLMEVDADSGGADGGPAAKVAGEEGGDAVEEEKLPFATPAELLDVFGQKEEQNLFLIQIIQRAEEEYDRLSRRLRRNQQEMRGVTDELEGNIQELKGKIELQRSKIESLRASKTGNASDFKAIDVVLRKLSSKVKSVYEGAFRDQADHTDPVDQIRDIEVRIDQLIDALIAIPRPARAMLEQKKEGERRAHNREVKKAEAERINAERAEKARARAQAETVRRVGKALVPRYQLKKYKKKKKKRDTATDEAKAEFIKFFTDSPMS